MSSSQLTFTPSFFRGGRAKNHQPVVIFPSTSDSTRSRELRRDQNCQFAEPLFQTAPRSWSLLRKRWGNTISDPHQEWTNKNWLVVWNMFYCSIIYGMSSFPLTNSYVFKDGWNHQPENGQFGDGGSDCWCQLRLEPCEPQTMVESLLMQRCTPKKNTYFGHDPDEPWSMVLRRENDVFSDSSRWYERFAQMFLNWWVLMLRCFVFVQFSLSWVHRSDLTVNWWWQSKELTQHK